MKIPLKWLEEYVDLPPKAQDLAHLLTMSGTAIETVTERGGCAVLHAEITTNRPDCLSLLGIAREIAAVTGKKLSAIPPSRIPRPDKSHLPLQIEIRDNKGCPKYLARAFDKVAVGPSPAWLQKNLDWMEQKAVNNVVDITNFCLYEIGQPLHAFDYDKIRGAGIIVRRARKGETIEAIDGVTYALDERILVIADAERPIAVAGIMGGKATEVTAATRRVVLESARFDPVLIRRTSRFLKLSSESSYRFERTVDPGKVREAHDRASALLMKLARAEAASRLIEKGQAKNPRGTRIRLRIPRVAEVLGLAVPRKKAAVILQSLGFKVKKRSKTELAVKTRLERPDVAREVDLIEEIARIYGFGKIPEALPPTIHTMGQGEPENRYAVLRRTKEALAAAGFMEAVTYSLLPRRSLERIGWGVEGAVCVRNPLNNEQEVLRPTGIVGLAGVLSRNLNRKEKDLAFFEVGKRFLDGAEQNALSLAVTGHVHFSWRAKEESSFYYLKGVVENCVRLLRKEVPDWTREAYRPEVFSENLSLRADGKRIGHCARLRPDRAAEWDLKQPVYYAEVDLDAVLERPDRVRRHRTLAKFPPVRRDIAFLVGERVGAGEITSLMKSEGAPFLRNALLFDEYRGGNIPSGKRSLAFSLEYQKKDGTFTDEEIRSVHQKIGAALVRDFGAELR